jgi:hypothetical protein
MRKVEKSYHETGVGQSDRVETHYEIGAEIDGTFVPFATVTQERVDTAKQRAERDAETAKAEKQAGSSSSGK